MGLPLGGPRKFVFWEHVVSKLSKKLTSWKKTFLSRGGRLTLIAVVLSAMPMYFMSLFMYQEVWLNVERDSLWKKIIKSIYGLQDNGFRGLARNRTFRSSCKFISRSYPTFHLLVRAVCKGGISFVFGRIPGGGFRRSKIVFHHFFRSLRSITNLLVVSSVR